MFIRVLKALVVKLYDYGFHDHSESMFRLISRTFYNFTYERPVVMIIQCRVETQDLEICIFLLSNSPERLSLCVHEVSNLNPRSEDLFLV